MKALQQAISNLNESMAKNEFPTCFDNKDQYNQWLRLEDEAPTVPVRKFVCRDCTIEFQHDMIRKGRCVNAGIEIERIVK